MNPGAILLVEDSDDDLALTLRAFRKARVANEVVVVRDGEQALDHLFGTGGLPAVVLLDLNLPKVGGLEVLRRLRADPRTALLRVVVLTTSKEEADVVQSYHLGAASYIRKPVDFDKFVEAVAALGAYWLMLNEPPPAGGAA